MCDKVDVNPEVSDLIQVVPLHHFRMPDILFFHE